LEVEAVKVEKQEGVQERCKDRMEGRRNEREGK
jgi:hypothetical protein